MIVNGLKPGVDHSYRFDAQAGEFKTVSREYTIFIPASIQALSLNTVNGFLSLPRVAGASVSAVTQSPVVVMPSKKPEPVAVFVAEPEPEPEIQPESEIQPEPEIESQPEPVAEVNKSDSGQGIVGRVKSTVFGWFQ